MKEHSLNPGDIVGRWEVIEYIANGCVYAVRQENDPTKYAMKIREPHNQRRFDKEIDVLKRLNADGGHPSFQTLHDYSHKDLYMILTYADPDLRLKRLGTSLVDDTIKNLDIDQFTNLLIDAVGFALDRGVFLSTGDTMIFVIDGRPFFVDVEGAIIFKNRSKKQVIFEHLSLGSPMEAIPKFLFYQKYFL